MEELFKEIDKDNSGTITIQEFERYLSKEEVLLALEMLCLGKSWHLTGWENTATLKIGHNNIKASQKQ